MTRNILFFLMLSINISVIAIPPIRASREESTWFMQPTTSNIMLSPHEIRRHYAQLDLPTLISLRDEALQLNLSEQTNIYNLCAITNAIALHQFREDMQDMQ